MENNKPNLDQFSYLSEHFSLIPLNGKEPFEEKWQQYCTTKREFNVDDFDGYNAGVCCGPASGILVLDLDDEQSFNAIRNANDFELYETFEVKTGSGKPHYYFHYPDDGKQYGNASIKHPVYAKHTIFDIRGVGGQVVAPGSVHPDTGKPYQLINSSDLAETPEWIKKIFDGDKPNTDALWDIPLPHPAYEGFIHSLNISDDKKDNILNGKDRGERSEAITGIIQALLGAKYGERLIKYIFNHYPIGQKYHEKGQGKNKWLDGEITRARDHMQTSGLGSRVPNQDQLGTTPEEYESILRELNTKHAVVMVGGKCLVLNEVYDPVFDRPDITFSTFKHFTNRYQNRVVDNPEKGRGLKKKIGIGDLWLNSSDRRHYDGIVFSPEENVQGYYNLYRGFSVEPKKGNWELYNNHIRDVICSRNKETNEYVLSWMAHLVQYPGGQRPGTAIVLKGKQGTGKGTFVNQFGKIFGSHFLHITNQKHLTGRFNGHQKDALLVFADEGIWAGDKAAEGILKGMITEDTLMIEQKGKDAFSVKNHLRMIVASNNDWVIPAGLEERRFFVLEVSNNHMQDTPYFEAIANQMDNGGREAMLFDLLHRDISDVDLSKFPRTPALLDQIIQSMSSFHKFWYDRLCDGYPTPPHMDLPHLAFRYLDIPWHTNGVKYSDDLRAKFLRNEECFV